MRILIVAHTSHHGGATNALYNLLSHLQALGHHLDVMCPSGKGQGFEQFARMNLPRIVFPMVWALPVPSSAFLALAQEPMYQVETVLRERKIDLVISNTLAIVHGAVLAARLGIPHITWVHELIEDDELLAPKGLPSSVYLSLLNRLNDHFVCCSKAVQGWILLNAATANTSVLYPYTEEALEDQKHTFLSDEPIQLIFVGLLTRRKNANFAIAVVKALRLRGHDVRLEVFGGDHDQSAFVRRQIVRWGLGAFVTMHGEAHDWRTRAKGRVIHFLCATHEPFGLTVPEALSAGIPVVSSRCGGPEELLPDRLLFARNDLDAAVRTIERVAADYPKYSQAAVEIYRRNAASVFSAEHQREVVRSAIDAAARDYQPKQIDALFMGPSFGKALNIGGLPRSELIANIAAVLGEKEDEIEQRIAAEKERPGSSVLADCISYDVVPFAMSRGMQTLCAEGSGVVIELTSTGDSLLGLQVVAFIMTRLLHEQSRFSNKLRILVVGDGLCFDSMRLASCGFDVDHVCLEGSITARVAAANLASFVRRCPTDSGCIRVLNSSAIERGYDALVCLDMIEQVPSPGELVADLSARLRNGGLAFISDCIETIRDQRPTNLLENEIYAGRLSWLGAPVGLDYQECNLAPFGKPFVFVKRPTGPTSYSDPIFSPHPFSFMLQMTRHMGHLV